ncbi:MAG: hypothetical protein PHD41_09795 [Methanosarcinaceae archaeon]|nr:hypothetical protein [Methanosarcinaceae archaeon]
MRPKTPFKPYSEAEARKQTILILENELRSLVAFPRLIPKSLREEIAEILVFEILFGQAYEIKAPDKFKERFGAFYPLYLLLRNSKIWLKIQKLANKNSGAGLACLKLLLPLLYDLIEKYSKVTEAKIKELDPEMEKLLREFEKILQDTFLPRRFSESSEGFSTSSNLSENVSAFLQLKGSQRFLEMLLQKLYQQLESFVLELEANLELFETLALLFPNRNWSYSVKELKKEPFYIHLKMLKRYSEFFKRNSELQRLVDFIGRQEFEPSNGQIHLSP